MPAPVLTSAQSAADRGAELFSNLPTVDQKGKQDAFVHAYTLGVTLTFAKVLTICDSMFGTPLEDTELPDMITALRKVGLVIEPIDTELARRLILRHSPNVEPDWLHENMRLLDNLGVLD